MSLEQDQVTALGRGSMMERGRGRLALARLDAGKLSTPHALK